MKIGPDGSLCRITSSAKDLINNVKIAQIPDSVPSYQLIVIRPQGECEELSEKSDDDDEEIFDDLSYEFPSNSIEKVKVPDAKIDKHETPNETERECIVREYNHQSRFRSRGRYQERNNYDRRNNFKHNARKPKNFSKREDSYNYCNRNYNSAANHSVSYNKPSIQHSSEDYSLSPWIDPSMMHQSFTCPPFPLVPLPNIPRNPRGLLGDFPPPLPPYSLPHIQSNEQSDIHEQSLPYSPVSSNAGSNFPPNVSSDPNSPYHSVPNFSANNHNSSFVHDQNSYPQRPNYPSNKQNKRFIRDQRHRNDSYRNYNKNNNQQHGSETHMKNKNLRKRKAWNENPRRHQNFAIEDY